MSASDVATLVKQAVDIVEVIGQVVPLRRSGNRHVGLCPFHQEKTPSFHVDANNQFYHCFGCGSGGDVLSFVMKHQNLAFGDALKYLAERYHIALPEGDRPTSGAAVQAVRKEREQLYGVLQLAADTFYRQLHHSTTGKAARDYIQQRALPEQVVETERIGYAPNLWDGLLRQLKGSGVDLELGVKAGLLAKGAKDRVYDRFRNRLIFPIRDDQSRVVAFGGRILPGGSEDEPKYLNSPETPVYHKGRMLYQLARAREACRQVRQVVLVEGYMDLLAFHAHGFYRVTATLGTALTPQQVRLLSRMADEVVLAYDTDEAGERAMLRSLPLFLQENLAVSCLRFPEGKDPDDFLRSRGLGAFEALLKERQDLGTFTIHKVLKRWDGTTGGKPRVLAELQPILEAVRQPVLKSEYLRLIADRLSLSESVIQRQVWHGKRSGGKSAAATQTTVLSRAPQAQSLEESILRLMIQYPDLIEEVENSEVLGCFQESPLKAIAEILFRAPHPPQRSFNASAVYDSLTDTGLKELFARLLLDSWELSEARVQMRDWIDALLERRTKQERLNLMDALRQAEREGDPERVKSLLMRIQALSATRQKVKQPGDHV